MNEVSQLSRRQFASGIVAGTAYLTAGLAAGSGLASDDPQKEKTDDSNAAPKPDEEKRPAERRPELPAELLLLSYLVREFPNPNFDKDILAGIFRDIRGDVARGRVLRDFPLKNSDEPAFAFRAFAHIAFPKS